MVTRFGDELDMEGKGRRKRAKATGKRHRRSMGKKVMVSVAGGKPRGAHCKVVTLCRVGKTHRRKR